MHNITRSILIPASFVLAPTFLFLYGIARWIDSRDGVFGPGLAWTIGHAMFLFGLLAFGLVMVGMYQRTNRITASRRFIAGLALILGLIGLIVFSRIAVIDIITGLLAKNHVSMGIISSQLNAYPNTRLMPFYRIGPLLFQLGIIILMVQLVVVTPRKLSWWSPLTLFIGFLMLGFNLNFLLPGAVLICIALLPLALKK